MGKSRKILAYMMVVCTLLAGTACASQEEQPENGAESSQTEGKPCEGVTIRQQTYASGDSKERDAWNESIADGFEVQSRGD